MSKEIKGNMSTFLFLLVSRACLSCEGWEVVEYDECENVFSGRVL